MTDFTSAALLPLSYTGNKRTSLTKADHKLSCAIPVWQFSPLMSWSRVQTTAGAALACLPRRRGSRVLRASSANHPRHRHQHIKLAVPTLHPLWLCFAPPCCPPDALANSFAPACKLLATYFPLYRVFEELEST